MVWLLLALGGCKKVEEIPRDLDGVVHHLWQHLDAGSDAELAEGVVLLDRALDGATLTEATDGSISRLDRSEAELVGVTDRDPADAAGIFLGNLIACGLPTVVEIFTHPAQDQLYPGVYEAYARAYHGDLDAFLAGDADRLTWDLDYEAKVLGSTYTGHTEALLRRVPGSAAERAPFREAHLVRFVAPEPARFEEGSQKTFDQDYQFEIYWSRDDGATLHAYAMWRQADWGTGFTSEDASVQRILLNGMEDWDRDTEQICADGGP